jgi:hypothetical protein
LARIEAIADRPAADDDQMLGRGLALEDRLVGEVGHRVEPGDRRHRGARAGGEDDALGAHAHIARLDHARADEARGGADHGDAQPLEARLAVHRRDRGDDAVNVVVDLSEVDDGLGYRHAEAAGAARALGGVRGGEQRLRRHAAVVEAVAAHRRLLDQHGARAELRGAGGDGEAARAGADHADIDIKLLGHAHPSSSFAPASRAYVVIRAPVDRRAGDDPMRARIALAPFCRRGISNPCAAPVRQRVRAGPVLNRAGG